MIAQLFQLLFGDNIPPGWVVERLEVFIKLIGPVEAEERKLTEALVAACERKIPKGVGPLSFEVLRREVGDWSRFNNRRQVSSYTGLCPREHSSGSKQRGGSVNKIGNPRVRAMLVEMVWRMIRWLPGYHALRKWMTVLGDASRSAAVRKKAIVAVARQLAVGLWRQFTRQITADKLGLIKNCCVRRTFCVVNKSQDVFISPFPASTNAIGCANT